jgi:hypothetical protein
MAPVISQFLYGTTDTSKLSVDEKNTLLAISGLAGNVVGAAVGNNMADIVSSGQAAQTSVDNNILWTPILIGAAWLIDKGMTAYDVYQDVQAVRNGEKTLDQLAIEKGEEYVVGFVVGSLAKHGLHYAKVGANWIVKHGDDAAEAAAKHGDDAAKAAEAVAKKDPKVRGKEAEQRVLEDMGLEKNTQKVSTAEGNSIPDALTATHSVEIKDCQVVSCTTQIRIQTEAAKQAGRESVLVTGTNTHLTEKTEEAFDRIITRDDLGPQ